MSFAHKRTPPVRGAALNFIGDQADEHCGYNENLAPAQVNVPPILRRHWFRNEELELRRAA